MNDLKGNDDLQIFNSRHLQRIVELLFYCSTHFLFLKHIGLTIFFIGKTILKSWFAKQSF
jgi:hypothetical protein